ncbi:MAG: DUF547 domain-containing protein [Candidatus Eisenbacteria bacterium]
MGASTRAHVARGVARAGAALWFGAALAIACIPVAAPLHAAPVPFDERLGADSLFARHVHDGLVDYAGIEGDRDLLDRSLRAAAEAPPETLRALAAPRQLAFYLNAYNLATIDLILRFRKERGGRLKSIQDIPGAWSRYSWKIAATDRTLDELEHRIIRLEFSEPRVHMALVCASRSCPPLPSTAFSGERLEMELDRAAREFVNDAFRNQFTPRDGKIRISKIFDWYGGDFVGHYRDQALDWLYGEKNGAVLAFASRYLPEETVRALRLKEAAIDYLPYDWSLNSAPPLSAPAAGAGAKKR